MFNVQIIEIVLCNCTRLWILSPPILPTLSSPHILPFMPSFPECPTGFYGNECTQICSDHCAGDQNSCHHVNGTCDLGCDPGYQGSSCTQGEYPTKKFKKKKILYSFVGYIKIATFLKKKKLLMGTEERGYMQ